MSIRLLRSPQGTPALFDRLLQQWQQDITAWQRQLLITFWINPIITLPQNQLYELLNTAIILGRRPHISSNPVPQLHPLTDLLGPRLLLPISLTPNKIHCRAVLRPPLHDLFVPVGGLFEAGGDVEAEEDYVDRGLKAREGFWVGGGQGVVELEADLFVTVLAVQEAEVVQEEVVGMLWEWVAAQNAAQAGFAAFLVAHEDDFEFQVGDFRGWGLLLLHNKIINLASHSKSISQPAVFYFSRLTQIICEFLQFRFWLQIYN